MSPPTPLLVAQRARLEPVLARLEAAVPESGFDEILLRYRVETTRSALSFVDEIATYAPPTRA